jgi:hypothetical protein
LFRRGASRSARDGKTEPGKKNRSVKIVNMDKIGQNLIKIQNLKSGLKNQKSIYFVKNRMIFWFFE